MTVRSKSSRAAAVVICSLIPVTLEARAEKPEALYIFPAGAQRGTSASVKVGGIYLHGECGFRMDGPGVNAPDRIRETETVRFDGPHFSGAASQKGQDYPRDYAATVEVAADAPLGVVPWHVWTAQGVTPARGFVIGDLPEVVEQEIDGNPIPVPVTLPVTINGRIFPREDVDIWAFEARAGETYTLQVLAGGLGSPLNARLVLYDANGRPIAEDTGTHGVDPVLSFTAKESGVHLAHIHDIAYGGLQPYVYRLTITAGPRLAWTYPLGGQRGTRVRFELGGTGLPDREAEIDLPASSQAATFAWGVTDGDQAGNKRHLLLDDLDEHLENEPNDEPTGQTAVDIPCVLNGRIGSPGDVDFWRMMLKQEEAVEFRLRAASLGSRLDARLAVVDAEGKTLAESKDAEGPDGIHLAFAAAADGAYAVRVADRFSSRGGPRFAYRLRAAAPPAPDFALRLGSDALTIPRGGKTKLSVSAVRAGGHKAPIQLDVLGLPPEISASEAVIPEDKNAGEIELTAQPNNPVTAYTVRVRGTVSGDGKPKGPRLATVTGSNGTPDRETARLAVTLATPFEVKSMGGYINFVPRGTVHLHPFVIQRSGFAGPIHARLADRQRRYLQGITAPEIIVPADADEFVYPIQMAPDVDLGRTARVVVMVKGFIVDPDGARHAVSYVNSEGGQAALSVVSEVLSVRAERTSVAVAPGGQVPLPVRVGRGPEVAPPVTVRLVIPKHMKGISADPVTLLEGAETAQLVIRAEGEVGPINMPLGIEARAECGGNPVVAKTTVDLVVANDARTSAADNVTAPATVN